jgi:mannose-6-phosphate isomerase-like protein (cupin superfamily)
MKEMMLPDVPDAKSPAGADVRLLMSSEAGGMIHSTVPPGQTNRAVVHTTVSEFWYILEGHGEIWRKDREQERVTTLLPGVTIDIPVGTAFQYRNVATGPLKFICVTMPKWPGAHESTYVEGTWKPSI